MAGAAGLVVVAGVWLAGVGFAASGADSATAGAASAAEIGPWHVKAPRNGQWTVKRRSKDGIAWVRDDGSIAYFQAFPLPRTTSEQALINEVRSFTAKVLSGSGKGTIVDANYAINRGRAYPCVKGSLAVEAPGAAAAANAARASSGTGASGASGTPGVTGKSDAVRVQSRALICHSKDNPEVGVFIGFSYPGAVTSRPLEADAQAFINGTTLVSGTRRKWER